MVDPLSYFLFQPVLPSGSSTSGVVIIVIIIIHYYIWEIDVAPW